MAVPQPEYVPEIQAALVLPVVLGKDLLKLLLHSHTWDCARDLKKDRSSSHVHIYCPEADLAFGLQSPCMCILSLAEIGRNNSRFQGPDNDC